MVAANSTKDYILYPNESVDKLSVNRPLSNLYYLLETISETESQLTITNATSSDYGLVKLSSYESFKYSDDGKADFSENALLITPVLDFASNQVVSDTFSKYAAYNATESIQPDYTLKLHLGDCSYMQLPNGINMIILSFDVGINDLPVMFGADVYNGSIDTPQHIKGYPSRVINDEASQVTMSIIRGSASEINPEYLFDKEITYDYMTEMKGSIHYNDCSWTSYSSYEQSYVEVTYSTTLNVLDLYKTFYDYSSYENYAKENHECEIIDVKAGFPRKYSAFTQKPIIISQLGFYNNDSRPDVLVGSFNKNENEEAFNKSDNVTEKLLTENVLKKDYSGNSVSVEAIGGSVVMKKYQNLYMKSGKIKDNQLTFDVSLKFLAGSADDPSMSRTIKNINGKASVQVILYGV